MNEERTMILNMLSEGAITVEEAEKLLSTLPDESEESRAITPSGAVNPKRLLIMVTENGKTTANIKIPFSLVKAGLRLGKASMALGAKYTNDGQGGKEILDILKNIDIDEVINSLNDGDITLPYVMVDMDDVTKGESVQVILE